MPNNVTGTLARHGTVLCDLVTGRVTALLTFSERSADDLANWLAAHRETGIISQGQGGICAEGARVGVGCLARPGPSLAGRRKEE